MLATRRKFLFWLGKAPAIVAASSIMPIVMRRESVVYVGNASWWDMDALYGARSGIWQVAQEPVYAGALMSVAGRMGVALNSAGPGGAVKIMTAGYAPVIRPPVIDPTKHYFVSHDPSVDLIPINRNDGFIRHRVEPRIKYSVINDASRTA